MIQGWGLRWRVLWREDHIWAYYGGLLALFLGRFWFVLGDQLALLPLYGLFVTQLTLIILEQHHRHGMEKIVRLTEIRPFKRVINETLFGYVCAFPAFVLLILMLYHAFPATPIYLLVLLVAEFVGFAISFGFACSIFSFKYAVPITLLFYFLLLTNHGYKLEHVPYLAPTLNFMYPDYPNWWNAAAVFSLSLLFCIFYLWRSFDRDRTSRRRIQLLLICVLIMYMSIPILHDIQKNIVAAQPYQLLQMNGMDVRYQGVSRRQAERYSQVVEDMHHELRERGLETHVKELIITRRNEVPQDEGIEHIVSEKGSTLYIEPYSNKFYEFNYGYNIIRDLAAVLIEDPTDRLEVSQAMIAEDKHGFFQATQIRLGIEQ